MQFDVRMCLVCVWVRFHFYIIIPCSLLLWLFRLLKIQLEKVIYYAEV